MLRRRTDQTWTSFDQFKKDSDNFIWLEQVELQVKVRSAPNIFDLAPNIPAPKQDHPAPNSVRTGTKNPTIQHQIFMLKMNDLAPK